MPGIVGLITELPRAAAEQQLLIMVKCLHHEPFYTCGTWSDPEHGIYVGWVARRGCFADGMPVRNENGKITLFFSGEEFPEHDLKRREAAFGTRACSRDWIGMTMPAKPRPDQVQRIPAFASFTCRRHHPRSA